jgi:hypothetical protein
MDRKQVYELIDGERNYQDELWGNDKHSLEEWLTYIQAYIADAQHILTRESKGTDVTERVMANFRKIAAMSVVAMEQHDTPPRKL